MRIFLTVILTVLWLQTVHAGEFQLKSSKFADKETIPNLYTCEEGNTSPPLSWTNPPNNTQSFALIFACIDSPIGTFYNWVLYNIPNTTTALKQGERRLPQGTLVGKNTLDEVNYRGPCPPDHLLHHYVITLYALDTVLDLSSGAEIDDVLEEIKAHTIDKAQLTGTFSH